jgi:hypothetical protein
MKDLTDSTAAARNLIAEGHAGEVLAQMSASELLQLDLDGPTLEILLAALAVEACDQIESIDG